MFGVSARVLKLEGQKRGISRPTGRRIPESVKDKIIELYISRPMSIKSISEEVDVSMPIVSKILKERGVQIWDKNKFL